MRSTRQTVLTLFAIAALCATGPFVMEHVGFNFLSMELGGVGDHFAGYNLDGAVLRLDLVLAFAGLLGLGLALALQSGRRTSRRTVLLAATIAVAAVVDSIQVLDLPAGGMPEYMFRRRVFHAAQLAHVFAGLVIACGIVVLRLRSRLGLGVGLAVVVGVGVASKVTDLVLLRGYEFTDAQIEASHLALAGAFVLCAVLLIPELRRRPVPIYLVSVLAGAVPLIVSQLSLAAMGDTLDLVAFNRATLLLWCSLLISIIGLSVDLARDAAASIRERERAYLRHVLDALPDLVHARDQRGHYRLLNRAAAAFLGGEPDDFEGQHATLCSHDDRLARRALKADRRILASGEPVRHPGLRVTDAEGRERLLQLLSLPLDPGHGEPPQVLSVATDVTQLKTTEKRLADRLDGERLLRRCLVRLLRSPVTEFPEAMHEVLARLGRTFDAAAVFAYELDEPAGMIRPREYWQKDGENPRRRDHDLRHLAWALDRLRAGKDVVYSDPDELPDDPAVVEYTRGVGLRFCQFVPIFAKDGSLWGVLGARFETPPADRGASLRRVLSYLADVYTASRDHYLAEQELQAASRAAADSARAKGEFLANMSHEIRTPLNAVIGLADILRGLDPSEEQAHYLGMIHQAGDALLGIINDVLDISKIEAGQLALDPVIVDLPALLNEIVDMMAYHAQQQGLELVYHLDPDARLRADLDPVRLKQVLINLLNNAIKFTETGHVSLRVRRIARHGAPWCRIDVADTGIGIPPETLDGIFDMFTQADASHTRKYGGTGLGLAICRNLVELMGGDISVSSRPGHGTRFTVRLPLAVSPDTDRAPLPDPALAGRRFLAVMPGAAARENLATTLQELGLAGAVLADVADLDLHLDRAPVDLVVADAQMDSAALADVQRVASSGATPPRRLLLSPLGDDRDHDALAAEGWDAALQKPVRRPHLRRQLRRFFAPDEAPHEAPDDDEAPMQLEGARVLLVEDNVFNQKVATKLLEGLGCRVTVAEDGRCAVDLAAAEDFDLVLMDCQMPVMDGLEATRRIRDLGDPRGRVPVVAMTANVLGEHRDACLAAGMDDFASKPVNRKTLRMVLERWAGRREPEPVA